MACAFRIAPGDVPARGWGAPQRASGAALQQGAVDALDGAELHARSMIDAEELMYRIELRGILTQIQQGTFHHPPPLSTELGLGLRATPRHGHSGSSAPQYSLEPHGVGSVVDAALDPAGMPAASLANFDSSASDAGFARSASAAHLTRGVSKAATAGSWGAPASWAAAAPPRPTSEHVPASRVRAGVAPLTHAVSMDLSQCTADADVVLARDVASGSFSFTATSATKAAARARSANGPSTPLPADAQRPAAGMSPSPSRLPLRRHLYSASQSAALAVSPSSSPPRPRDPYAEAAQAQADAAGRRDVDASKQSFDRTMSNAWRRAGGGVTPPVTPVTGAFGSASQSSRAGGAANDEASLWFDRSARGSLHRSKRGSWCRVASDAWTVYDARSEGLISQTGLSPSGTSGTGHQPWKVLDAHTSMTGFEKGVWRRVNMRGHGDDDLRSVVDLRRESDNRWAARDAIAMLEMSVRAEITCEYYDLLSDMFAAFIFEEEWAVAVRLYSTAALRLVQQQSEDDLFTRAAEVDRIMEDPSEHGMLGAWVTMFLSIATTAVEQTCVPERLFACEVMSRSAIEGLARIAPLEFTHRRCIEDEEQHKRSLGLCFFMTFRRYLTGASKLVMRHYKTVRSYYHLSRLDEPRCMLAAEVESWALHGVYMRKQARVNMVREEAAARIGVEATHDGVAVKFFAYHDREVAAIKHEAAERASAYAAARAAVERDIAGIEDRIVTVHAKRRAARAHAARRARIDCFIAALHHPSRRERLEAIYGRRPGTACATVREARRRADRDRDRDREQIAAAYTAHRARTNEACKALHIATHAEGKPTGCGGAACAVGADCFRCASTEVWTGRALGSTRSGKTSTTADAAGHTLELEAGGNAGERRQAREVTMATTRRMPSPPPRPGLLLVPAVWLGKNVREATAGGGDGDGSDDSAWDSDGGGEDGYAARTRQTRRIAEEVTAYCNARVLPWWGMRSRVDELLCRLHELPACFVEGTAGVPAAPFAYFQSDGLPRDFVAPPRTEEMTIAPLELPEGNGVGRHGRMRGRRRMRRSDNQHGCAPAGFEDERWGGWRSRRARSAPGASRSGDSGGISLWAEYRTGLCATEHRCRRHIAGDEFGQRRRIHTVLERVLARDEELRRSRLPDPALAPLAAEERSARSALVNDCVGDYIVLHELHLHVGRSIVLNTAKVSTLSVERHNESPAHAPHDSSTRTLVHRAAGFTGAVEESSHVDAHIASCAARAVWAADDARRRVHDISGDHVMATVQPSATSTPTTLRWVATPSGAPAGLSDAEGRARALYLQQCFMDYKAGYSDGADRPDSDRASIEAMFTSATRAMTAGGAWGSPTRTGTMGAVSMGAALVGHDGRDPHTGDGDGSRPPMLVGRAEGAADAGSAEVTVALKTADAVWREAALVRPADERTAEERGVSLLSNGTAGGRAGNMTHCHAFASTEKREEEQPQRCMHLPVTNVPWDYRHPQQLQPTSSHRAAGPPHAAGSLHHGGHATPAAWGDTTDAASARPAADAVSVPAELDNARVVWQNAAAVAPGPNPHGGSRCAAKQAVTLARMLRDTAGGYAAGGKSTVCVAETLSRQRVEAAEATARATLREVQRELHSAILQRDMRTHRYRVLRRLAQYNREIVAEATIEARWRRAAIVIQRRWRGYRARVVMDQERREYRYRYMDRPPAPHIRTYSRW